MSGRMLARSQQVRSPPPLDNQRSVGWSSELILQTGERAGARGYILKGADQEEMLRG